MTWRQIAIIVGPAILAILVALAAMVLGYGEMIGPRAILAAAVWVGLCAWSWPWRRR